MRKPIKFQNLLYKSGDTTINVAIAHYAGKSIKGIAKCSPVDTYDTATGQKLAEARCAQKIAVKKYKKTLTQLAAAQKAYDDAQATLDKYMRYSQDAMKNLVEANNNVQEIIDNI